MEMDVQAKVNAPAEKVWSILGEQFGEIDKWCATVYESKYKNPG